MITVMNKEDRVKSLEQMLFASHIPAHMHDSLVHYILHGRRVGHFLTAVLSNDLREAALRADADNLKALGAYAMFLHMYAPSASWGSPENVEAWMAQRGLEAYDNERTT